MFTFNKNDILQINKTDAKTIIQLEYTNMRTCNVYCGIIDLSTNEYYIDEYDMFCDYMKLFEDKKQSPVFTRKMSSIPIYNYIEIDIPFDIPFKKSSSNIIIQLPQKYHCDDSKTEALNNKIKLLEKKISDDYVIPYVSIICHTDLTFKSTKEEILHEINKQAVLFCKEQYYIENAYVFKYANYDEKENKVNQIIMLFDDKNELLQKYGCNYVCYIKPISHDPAHYTNFQIKIMRIPAYKLFKDNWKKISVNVKNSGETHDVYNNILISPLIEMNNSDPNVQATAHNNTHKVLKLCTGDDNSFKYATNFVMIRTDHFNYNWIPSSSYVVLKFDEEYKQINVYMSPISTQLMYGSY